MGRVIRGIDQAPRPLGVGTHGAVDCWDAGGAGDEVVVGRLAGLVRASKVGDRPALGERTHGIDGLRRHDGDRGTRREEPADLEGRHPPGSHDEAGSVDEIEDDGEAEFDDLEDEVEVAVEVARVDDAENPLRDGGLDLRAEAEEAALRALARPIDGNAPRPIVRALPSIM